MLDIYSNRSLGTAEANLSRNVHSDMGIRIVENSSKNSLELSGLEDMSQKGDNIMEENSQARGNPECDIYSGRWVIDEEYPLYSSESCPFIDEGFNCDGNGRTGKGYMKWRWKPNDCEIPRNCEESKPGFRGTGPENYKRERELQIQISGLPLHA